MFKKKKHVGPGTLDVLAILFFLGVLPTVYYFRWHIIFGVGILAVIGFSL